jgi:hypothetical protein
VAGDTHTHRSIAIGYALFAAWVIAPIATGSGVLAIRLARPDDPFALALGTTTAFGLLGGLSAASILRRRIGRPSARDGEAAGR